MAEEKTAKTKAAYKIGIRKFMRALDTYKPQFEQAIDRLATLYADRDNIEQEFIDSGSAAVTYHTNKFGAENLEKNPILEARDKIYTQILTHEKELGLTPSALKKMNDQALKPKSVSGFASALKDALDAAGN